MNTSGNNSNFEGCKMTLKEKLDLIDHEIRLLHKFCKDTGYSSEKIHDFAKPFLRGEPKKLFFSTSKVIYFSLIIAVFSILFYLALMHPAGQAVVSVAFNKVQLLFTFFAKLSHDWCTVYITYPVVFTPPKLFSHFDLNEFGMSKCKAWADIIVWWSKAMFLMIMVPNDAEFI